WLPRGRLDLLRRHEPCADPEFASRHLKDPGDGLKAVQARALPVVAPPRDGGVRDAGALRQLQVAADPCARLGEVQPGQELVAIPSLCWHANNARAGWRPCLGWSRTISPVRGPLAGRSHVRIISPIRHFSIVRVRTG